MTMAHEIFAPWAQVVPNAPFPMTIAQMQALPEDGWTYELVDGRLIRMPGSGSKASRLAARLIIAIGTFTQPRKLCDVSGADGEYDLTRSGAATETALIPDVAFVRAGRLEPLNSKAANSIPHLAPDLVAEVASPNQYHPEMAAKARLYLESGVHLVWIVWPDDEQVDVWRAGNDTPIATLGVNDSLDGLDVIAGFTHPVADLFTE
jgi:Uma2 family endonuclease